jgi:hypothetical protein
MPSAIKYLFKLSEAPGVLPVNRQSNADRFGINLTLLVESAYLLFLLKLCATARGWLTAWWSSGNCEFKVVLPAERDARAL